MPAKSTPKSTRKAGRKLSPEGRARIVAANKRRAGRKITLSPEHRAKIVAANERRKGQPLSPETRAKIAAAKKGQPLSPEHRAKIAAANERRGSYTLSPKHRAKIAAANERRKGQPGRPHSPETRAKMSAAKKGCRFVPRNLVDQVESILDRHRIARPEPATSAPEPRPAILLGSKEEPVYVREVNMGVLLPSEHRALEIAMRAYPRGFSLKEMNQEYGNTGWRTTLGRLKDKNPEIWESAFAFPRSSKPGTNNLVRILPW